MLDNKEWAEKFLASPSIRKLSIHSSEREYYAELNGSRITKIYFLDEAGNIFREPLSALLLSTLAVPLSTAQRGFMVYGNIYTEEDLEKDEKDITMFENFV